MTAPALRLAVAAVRMYRAHGRALFRAFRAVRAAANAIHRAHAPRLYGDRYRRHRRSCHICNPGGFPRPLAINGHVYRTRQRRRR